MDINEELTDDLNPILDTTGLNKLASLPNLEPDSIKVKVELETDKNKETPAETSNLPLGLAAANIEENVATLESLIDFKNIIIKQGGMNRSVALALDFKHKGLLHKKLTLEMFTEFPSKTQQDSTVNYLQNQISNKLDEIKIISKTILEETINKVESLSISLKESKENELRNFTTDFLSKDFVLNLLNKIKNGDDIIYVITSIDNTEANVTDTISLLNTPIKNLVSLIVKFNEIDITVNFSDLLNILESNNYLGFIKSTIDVEEQDSNVSELSYYSKLITFRENITLNDLINFINSPSLISKFSSLHNDLDESLIILKKILNDFSVIGDYIEEISVENYYKKLFKTIQFNYTNVNLIIKEHPLFLDALEKLFKNLAI